MFTVILFEVYAVDGPCVKLLRRNWGFVSKSDSDIGLETMYLVESRSARGEVHDGE